jgi:hypothetical protein
MSWALKPWSTRCTCTTSIHATILHLLGFDHELLTYFHQGRDERLTDVYGRVIYEVVA